VTKTWRRGGVGPGFAEKESDLGRRWFGPIDLRVAELSATVPPLRGQRSRGERGKKLPASVEMTEKCVGARHGRQPLQRPERSLRLLAGLKPSLYISGGNS
jgi:hypothetical protein